MATGLLLFVIAACVSNIKAVPPSLAPYRTFPSLAPYDFSIQPGKPNFSKQPREPDFNVEPREPSFNIKPKDTIVLKSRPLSYKPRAETELMCKKKTQKVELYPGDVVTFYSKNYPEKYQMKSKCNWKIKGQTESTRVSITCEAFTLQAKNSKGKCVDFLKINSAKYCGTNSPTYSSNKNIVKMRFKANGKKQFSGFKCTAVAYEEGVTTEPPTGDCKCGRVNRATRIVNGQETEVLEYPWQAGIVSYGSDRTWCGGSLINSKWVLTAAHCTDDTSPSDIQVLLGEHTIYTTDGTEQRFDVSQVINHESYGPDPWDNGHDISLLELNGEVDFSSTQIRPICLPTTTDLFAGAQATVTGFGRTAADEDQSLVLMEVDIPVVTNDDCKNTYGSSFIDDTMICAGEGAGNGACMGDSGGPLITSVGDYHIQIGVVSFGSSNCDALGVYARVTVLQSWVEGYAMTGNAKVCTPHTSSYLLP